MSLDSACSVADNSTLLCGQSGGEARLNTLPAALTNAAVVSVSMGQYHGCALNTYGSISCFGSVTQKDVPRLPNGTTWAAVSCGGSSACGITSCGALQCWFNPDDAYGEQPPGKNAPALNNTYWMAISLGSTLACGIDSAAQLHCFPVVSGAAQLTWPEKGGAAWVSVAVGYAHACAIDSMGSMACEPAFAEDDRASPPPLPAGRTWKAVAAATGHTCGIDSAGGLHCFGSNASNQTAVPELGAGVTWAAVACASDSSCGVDTDGGMHCWGGATDGSGGLEALDVVWRTATDLVKYPNGTALDLSCPAIVDAVKAAPPPSTGANVGIIAGAVVGGIVLLSECHFTLGGLLILYVSVELQEHEF